MMEVKTFFDKDTYTLTYIVYDKKGGDCVIIDSVWNYNPNSCTLSLNSVRECEAFISANKLSLKMILETHVHADHITASNELKKIYKNVPVGISKNITIVQETFKKMFNLENFKVDGSQFDRLFNDGEEFSAGNIKIKFLMTPGHTPACSSYLIDGMLFTGDALFMPDYGTGRCDFPKGSAKDLFHSVSNKMYKLPPETKVYVGHDYQPNGRDLKFMSTIKDEMEHNIWLKKDTKEEEFVTARQKRDAELEAPKLLFPSIQINLNCGVPLGPENNGTFFLKLPLTFKE